MQKLGEIGVDRYNSQSSMDNGISKGNAIDNRTIDYCLASTVDLIEDKYKGWFANQVKRLGRDRYFGVASDARRGRSPKRLFVYLLRNTN